MVKGKIKFPQKKKDLQLICELQGDNFDYKNIIKQKENYTSIMIGLGRELSDEIVDYVITGEKGEILNDYPEEEIKSIIKKSASTKTVIAKKLITSTGEL